MSLKCCLNEIDIALEVLLYKDTSGFDSFLANVHILYPLITEFLGSIKWEHWSVDFYFSTGEQIFSKVSLKKWMFGKR